MMNEAVTAWKNGQAMIALGYTPKDAELYRRGYLVGCFNIPPNTGFSFQFPTLLEPYFMGLEDGLYDTQRGE